MNLGAYLDHNATTPLDMGVVDVMLPYLRQHHGNPSSLHSQGRLARHAIETAREQVASWLGVQPAQVIFTSGGTEANNLALSQIINNGAPQSLAVSAIEHASVLEMAERLRAWGAHLEIIPVDAQGRVTASGFESILTAACPRLVSVMYANNETGVIQDIATFAAKAREHGVIFHTDAVQAAGKVALDFDALGVQLLTVSAHKIYGPKGVGALIVDRGLEVQAWQVGGGQEAGRRSGTESVAAIVGFGAAAELAARDWRTRHDKDLELRRYFEQRLAAHTEIKVFGADAERLPNTVFFAVPGIDGETLLMEFDRAGIAVSSGSACDSRKIGPSHVLLAMGVSAEVARCSVRVSLGRDNTRTDIDALMAVLEQQLQRLRTMSALSWA
ncbi:MAG: cysteine desulfurase [Gammaproteobacteria bacterium]|nr:cysteine desulfurase [Gammaproteobacteria bacterium]